MKILFCCNLKCFHLGEVFYLRIYFNVMVLLKDHIEGKRNAHNERHLSLAYTVS